MAYVLLQTTPGTPKVETQPQAGTKRADLVQALNTAGNWQGQEGARKTGWHWECLRVEMKNLGPT